MAYGIKLSGARHFKKVAKPSLTGTYTYNTLTQTVSVSGAVSKAMVVSGTTSAADAGTYAVTFTLNKGYKWADGDKSTSLTLSWTIGKKAISLPSLTGTYTYNLASQTVSISSYDSKAITVGGTRTATEAGTYTVTFTIGSNYKWTDGNASTTRSATWTINKRSVAIPYLTNTSPACTGANVSPTVNNVNSSYVTQSGTSSSNVLGSHTITWALKNTKSCEWSDGSAGNKTATWSVTAGTIYYTIKVQHESRYSQCTRSCLYGQTFEDIMPVDLVDGRTGGGTSTRAQNLKVKQIYNNVGYVVLSYTLTDWHAEAHDRIYRRTDLPITTVITNGTTYLWEPNLDGFPYFNG